MKLLMLALACMVPQGKPEVVKFTFSKVSWSDMLLESLTFVTQQSLPKTLCCSYCVRKDDCSHCGHDPSGNRCVLALLSCGVNSGGTPDPAFNYYAKKKNFILGNNTRAFGSIGGTIWSDEALYLVNGPLEEIQFYIHHEHLGGIRGKYGSVWSAWHDRYLAGKPEYTVPDVHELRGGVAYGDQYVSALEFIYNNGSKLGPHGKTSGPILWNTNPILSFPWCIPCDDSRVIYLSGGGAVIADGVSIHFKPC